MSKIKDVAMDDSEYPKTYTEEELNDKYSEYVQIGEEYSYEFNILLNVAKNLISLKQEIVSGKVENRELGNPLTVDYEFIDDLVEILDKNGLSCYNRYEWEDNDLYVGEVNTVTTLSIDGYEFTFNEGDGSISKPHVEKEKYGPSVPIFEFDKVIEIIDTKIEEVMKNRYSLLEQNESTEEKEVEIVKGNSISIDERFKNIIVEKLRIIEEADDMNSIPTDLFTLSEIQRLRDSFRDKEDCFRTTEEQEELLDHDWYAYGEATRTTSVFQIGDKIIRISDFDGATNLKVVSSEQYIKDREEYIRTQNEYGEEVNENWFVIPNRAISVQEMEEILSKNKENEKPKDARQLFEESLLRDDVVEYYLSKTPEELQKEIGPEVARMVGFEQKNSHHCYDLWEHTLRTVEGIKSEGLTPEQFKKLRVAAFFHDIGKPDVAKFNEKTGQQVFYGHANHSVDVAKPIIEKLGYSEKEVEELGFYIGHHDDFISYKSQIAPWMKNHEFIRGIDSNTVAEKIIENQYNFEEMGYDKDQIRYICYALGHNGEEPVFMTQDGPMNIKVDMAEVQEKIDSGDYDAKYVPSEEDYKLLLELCKADASAQSEIAMQQGKQVGSKKEKLENMNNIQDSIPEAFKSIVEKVTGYTFEQFIKDSVPQSYGEKRPMVICKDGTECSIQASSFHACSPQKDGLESYEEFEIGAIAEGITDDLEKYLNYDGVAGNVPKEVIEEIIKAHGGLDKKIMKQRVKEQKEVYKPKNDAYEQMVKEASGGNEYLEKMIRYATRRVEVRETEEKAKQLSKDYEEQLPKDQQSLDDNN